MKKKMVSRMLSSAVVLTIGSAQVMAASGVGGDETNVDAVVMSSGNWTVLLSEQFSNAAPNTHCVATGSADAMNPVAGDDNRYRFVLSINDPNPPIDGPCERSVEFDENGTDAQHVEEVSSTCTFRHVEVGSPTIFWLARKVPKAGGTPNLTVSDSSMSFVCLNNLLDTFDGEGDGNQAGGGN